ncbi:MAG TPA: type II secretion system protein GspD [Verrucomicrobiota bacterium]|nr:type II secretion system protein GspD [Verrucomicrobiota bacterium]
MAILLVAASGALTGCRHTRVATEGYAPEKIKYDETYDWEIKEVLALARENRWEEASARAAALRQKDPQNPMLERIHNWTVQQGRKHREQALEDEIREIDAKSSVFSPSITDLLLEQKERGLPATKDVRDTVDRIDSTPYIPETFGKTLREKGPLFDLDSSKGRMARILEKEVSIHLDNVPLETIIVNISQSAGINIVADKSLPALKQTLSVHLDKVRLDEFFRYISRNYDLQFQVGDELVWVVDAKDPKHLMEETRFYRLRKGFVLPAQFGADEATIQRVQANNVVTTTETQKFRKFVNDETPTMPSLERAIKELFTGSKFLIDYERNLVVARGTPEQLEVLERIIEEFDRPIQQVLIEARFVTISKPAFLQLGVLWETGRLFGSVRDPVDYTGLIGPQDQLSVGVGLQESFTNILSREALSATISALEQSGESQTLSAPRLTVLNNRPARISDGKVQYFYEEYTVSQTITERTLASSFVPQGKPTKITSGAELDVLASISGDGKSILLALNPRVNTDVELVNRFTLTDTEGNAQFKIFLPEYRTQEIATRMTVKSGETVVMGGVLEREKTTYVESVPVLGNLPIIGTFFRRRTEVDRPRYLLIFVTATIVADTGEFVVYDDPEPTTN